MISHIPDSDLLDKDEIVTRLQRALQEKTPFSFVRIGDGENFVLSQDSVYPMEKTLEQLWVKEANKGRKGVKLPDLVLRDRLVEAIREADIVGVLAKDDRVIRAHPTHKRNLTNSIFDYFQLQPPVLANAIVNRDLLYHAPFWQMLKEQGTRLALISRWAGSAKQRLIRPPYELQVAFTLPFERYLMMDDTLKIMEERKDEFDLALISCGVNAVVLTHEIKKRTGKAAMDFGIASQIISSVKI
ncbi:GT-D fold domain-containing glycosyltransferase [Paenibacillus sp. CAU 1782]